MKQNDDTIDGVDPSWWATFQVGGLNYEVRRLMDMRIGSAFLSMSPLNADSSSTTRQAAELFFRGYRVRGTLARVLEMRS